MMPYFVAFTNLCLTDLSLFIGEEGVGCRVKFALKILWPSTYVLCPKHSVVNLCLSISFAEGEFKCHLLQKIFSDYQVTHVIFS